MATAAPFVKLLRQLAAAKDDYRTGALDISWEGGRATLFLVFGQPNHAVMEPLGGQRLEGTEALTALVRQLPPRFELSPWRKEVVRTETLTCSLEELMEPFAQMAGAASPGPVPAGDPGAAALVAGESVAQPDFGIADFPLLPLGPSLWADASASVVHLDVLLPSLPDALVVLTGPRLRAAAVVVHQQLIDAVWVDEEERLVGEAAAIALMGAREGSVSGYRLEEPGLAEALTMLWRSPSVYRDLPAGWVNADNLLGDLLSRRRDSAIVVTGEVHGVALVAGGSLVGVYTESERLPLASPARLAALLASPGARVTLRQSPEESRADRLPETAYHAFVDDRADRPAALAEALVSVSPADAAQPEAAISAPAAPRPAATPEARDWPPPPPSQAPQPAPPAPWGAPSEPGPASESAPSGSVPFSDPGATPDLDALYGDGAAGDFEGMKADLIQIGSLWLGSDGVAPVAEMLNRTRPSIEDVMAAIEAIKRIDLPGHEPSVIQAMAREMHYHAAEYLSGL